jgi:hypothetical protein
MQACPAGNSRCSRYQRRARRKFRNVAKNRPETTNLNHQNIIRRVFIAASSPG